jgi:hypothetical protein
MDFGIVLLNDRLLDVLEILLAPVDLERASDASLKPLLPSKTSSGPVMPR